MACSGTHCTNHGTGTSTCSNHRGTCSTNRTYSPSSEFTGGSITAADINLLRTSIRDEITRYNLHADHSHTLRQTSAYQTSTVVDNAHINDMEQMVYDGENRKERVGTNYASVAAATTWGNKSISSYSEGSVINATHWTTLKSRYDNLRTDCICNSDCSCNLVCACHNDCGCNYSDIRLKREIQFLENRGGINYYSFKYIWDNVRRTGVMAQEILESKWKDAVKQDKKGYYMVDYSMLPQ